MNKLVLSLVMVAGLATASLGFAAEADEADQGAQSEEQKPAEEKN